MSSDRSRRFDHAPVMVVAATLMISSLISETFSFFDQVMMYAGMGILGGVGLVTISETESDVWVISILREIVDFILGKMYEGMHVHTENNLADCGEKTDSLFVAAGWGCVEAWYVTRELQGNRNKQDALLKMKAAVINACQQGQYNNGKCIYFD